jgi:3-hydroxybutyryl-CoA dehydrogenase
VSAAAAGVVGVVGAGTMGSGIAQLAAAAGARTLVHDPDELALQRGLDRARDGLARWAEKGRASANAAGLLAPAAAIEDLGPCDLVVEAAPESLALKHELFAALSQAAPGAVLASNTSSIPITDIAPAAADPGRVVGLHFFNPAPLMALVELIAGLDSSPQALAVARATAEAMGKRVIDAADGPGFLINRCNRPFGLEGLRLLQERVAGAAEIDRIVRLGGGFRMGPFELADLVGLDTGLEVARSFAELSFGEPRWRPSPLVARMVAAGRIGRKAGRGWYAYESGRPHRQVDEPPPRDGVPGGGEGRLLVVAGDLTVAHELRALATAAGFDVREPDDVAGEVPWLAVDCGGDPGDSAESGPPTHAPQLMLCAEGSLAQLDAGGAAAGLHVLPPLETAQLVELTRTTGTSPAAAARAEELVAALGRHAAWVGDAPGLVLGRIVCQLVNEAAFAVGEGVGTPDDVDAGMVLGLNHPRGPLTWGDAIGLDHVLAVLDALHGELGEERYRAAPLLRRLVAEGRLGVATGAGFHEHP